MISDAFLSALVVLTHLTTVHLLLCTRVVMAPLGALETCETQIHVESLIGILKLTLYVTVSR